jgi:mannose-6-phosphate isomerase-like protein (cupin superfamily)
MDAFEIGELQAERERSGRRYHEFLRVPALSAGLYVLPAGGVDGQQPHTEDEVYYVVGGRGAFRCGEEDRPVAAGSVLYVPAHVEHRFHSIEKELSILVFFAPAEGSRA